MQIIYTQLYGIKYFYLIQIIFKQIDWLIDGTLTGIITPGEWSLTFRSSLILYPGHPFLWRGVLPLC